MLSKMCYPNLLHVRRLIIVFLAFGIVLLLLLGRPLADLAGVGLLAVQVGENQVKDLGVPAYGVAFKAFLDSLYNKYQHKFIGYTKHLKKGKLDRKKKKKNIPEEAPASLTCCPWGR